jgi:hypothetical protein
MSSGGSEVCGKGLNIQLARTKGGGKKEVMNIKKRGPHIGGPLQRGGYILKGGIYCRNNIYAIA